MASAYVVVTFAAVSAVAKQSCRREGGAGAAQAVPEQIPHLTMIANSTFARLNFLRYRRDGHVSLTLRSKVRSGSGGGGVQEERAATGKWQEVEDGGSLLNEVMNLDIYENIKGLLGRGPGLRVDETQTWWTSPCPWIVLVEHPVIRDSTQLHMAYAHEL